MLAQTADESLVKASAIAEGFFFDNTVPTKLLIPANSTTAILKDPDGKALLAVYFPKDHLMDESLKERAIPAEYVQYSDKLIRDYEGRRPLPVASGIGVRIGEPFVRFEYTDIDSNVWNNDKLKDRIYVINIWQTECGPCRREMPALSEWKDRFPQVVFLSASRHNKEEILPIAEQHHFTWIHLQEATDLVALVGQQGFPLTIVVDKNGIVRHAKVGASAENQAEAVAVIENLSY
ncbi:MAG: TlpA family protein disulfide reductase [Muribaculaceae bacterium]|nr:TlpA family protein disulfide reductase [Muribaculaceae bacterium]MDE6553737.1 TlpA family protein disulfide reductase [Muribaculaceae bacterium]